MEIVTIKISESDIKTYRYDEETITTKDEIDNNLYHKLSTTIKYKYQDTLFKYYKIEKEYQDGYHNDLEGYIKDETNCISLYSEKKNNILKKTPLKKEIQNSMKINQSKTKTSNKKISNTNNNDCC